MNEKPILFSGEMVRAILEGRKTQTRRVMKPQLTVNGVRHYKWERPDVIDRCPYGKIGDRLWIRETFGFSTDDTGHVCLVWAADLQARSAFFKDSGEGEFDRYEQAVTCPTERKYLRWKPSIFMPRAASRTTLEITNVRVERLQEISEVDAIAEGVHSALDLNAGDKQFTHRRAFQNIWDALNARRGYLWGVKSVDMGDRI